MLRILLTLGGLLLVADVARSEAPPDARLVEAVDKLVAKYDGGEPGPGVAVMVRQPGQFLFMKGYGFANHRTRAPITPQTRFYLASVSKSFTAVAVLLLHERGQLSIEDNVRYYLPEVPVYYNNPPIRIKDLLHHISGLPEYLDFQNVPAYHRGFWVGLDYLADLARRPASHPLRFATGQKYEYCNTNYLLLALIVERVAKKTFGTFLHEEVFVPAGMKNAYVFEIHNTLPRRTTVGTTNASGYEKGKKKGEALWKESWGTPPLRWESLVPLGDGGIWCNLEDMARWDTALREGHIIKPATMQLALTPSHTRDGKTNNYGFGWSVFFNKEDNLIGYGHHGLWRGFRTCYYNYLLKDRTTVILSNRGDFDDYKFWYDLDDVIEKHKPAR